MEFCERIAAARKAAGLTQEQLGEQIGVTRQAVSKWESGQVVPDALTVARMCEVLHVSADHLLLGIEQDLAPEPPEPSGPQLCPCCGREVPGRFCSTCGYIMPSQPERGPRYAVILRQQRLTPPSPEETQTLVKSLNKYCGAPEDYALMCLEQLSEYGTMIPIRRDLPDLAVQWIASHLDQNFFQIVIVEDAGETDDALVLKPSAMELPPPAPTGKEKAPLGFWGMVGAIALGIVGALVLLSLF